MDSYVFSLSSLSYFWPLRTMRHGQTPCGVLPRRPHSENLASKQMFHGLQEFRKVFKRTSKPIPRLRPIPSSRRRILFIPAGGVPCYYSGTPTGGQKPVVRPQVSLFGVTSVGDYKSACISYPGRPLQKGEREVVTVKIGDRVGEYKVTKISEDRIGLKAQEDNFEVLLYDNRAPKKRVIVKTQNKPTTTTSTVPGTPGAAPAAARPVPVPGTPSGEGIAEAPKPIPLPPAAAGSSDPSAITVPPSSSPPDISDYIRAKRERVRQQKEQMLQRTPPAGE